MKRFSTNDHAFSQAIGKTLAWEGGFVNHPQDKGGATKYGISQKFLAKAKGRDVSIDEIEILTQDEAVALYYTHFWEAYKYYRIDDEELAGKIFDLAVNIGPKMAHRLLQRALRALGAPVVEDGILGPKTLVAVNENDPYFLIVALRSEAAGFYRALALRNGQACFLRGWLRRAYDEMDPILVSS